MAEGSVTVKQRAAREPRTQALLPDIARKLVDGPKSGGIRLSQREARVVMRALTDRADARDLVERNRRLGERIERKNLRIAALRRDLNDLQGQLRHARRELAKRSNEPNPASTSVGSGSQTEKGV